MLEADRITSYSIGIMISASHNPYYDEYGNEEGDSVYRITTLNYYFVWSPTIGEWSITTYSGEIVDEGVNKPVLQ